MCALTVERDNSSLQKKERKKYSTIKRSRLYRVVDDEHDLLFSSTGSPIQPWKKQMKQQAETQQRKASHVTGNKLIESKTSARRQNSKRRTGKWLVDAKMMSQS